MNIHLKCFEGNTPGMAVRLEEFQCGDKKEMLCFTEILQISEYGCSKEGRDVFFNLVQPVRSDMLIEFPISELKQIQEVFGNSVMPFIESIMWVTDEDGDVGVIHSLGVVAQKLRERYPEAIFSDTRQQTVDQHIQSTLETHKWVEENFDRIVGEFEKNTDGE